MEKEIKDTRVMLNRWDRLYSERSKNKIYFLNRNYLLVRINELRRAIEEELFFQDKLSLCQYD